MKKLLIIVSIILFTACGSSSDVSGLFNSDNPGYLSLGFTQAQDFNPNADHGQISKYKLTISGSSLDTPIERYYPVGTKDVTFEGFPGGSTLRVKIEAINVNDICVRRGLSEDILIKGGQYVSSNITINNVPIFANVRDGATVYNNRFAPKVFAPGEITFQLSDLYNGSNSVIVDQITNESLFSISSDISYSVTNINAPTLSVGSHELEVEDPDTNESSNIKITVLDGTKQKGLPTTAGNYVGSLMNFNTDLANNFVMYHKWQINEL